MDRQEVYAGGCKIVDVALGFDDHEVGVKRFGRHS